MSGWNPGIPEKDCEAVQRSEVNNTPHTHTVQAY